MSSERIQVKSYAGYRGDELPRSLLVREREIRVSEVLKRWVEEGLRDRTRKRFFRLGGTDGIVYTIYVDEKHHEWFLSEIER